MPYQKQIINRYGCSGHRYQIIYDDYGLKIGEASTKDNKISHKNFSHAL